MAANPPGDAGVPVITPGLWRRALRGGAQWRLLALWVAVLWLPLLAALVPLGFVLRRALDYSTRAPDLVAALDASALVDLTHVLTSPESGAALMKREIARARAEAGNQLFR